MKKDVRDTVGGYILISIAIGYLALAFVVDAIYNYTDKSYWMRVREQNALERFYSVFCFVLLLTAVGVFFWWLVYGYRQMKTEIKQIRHEYSAKKGHGRPGMATHRKK